MSSIDPLKANSCLPETCLRENDPPLTHNYSNACYFMHLAQNASCPLRNVFRRSSWNHQIPSRVIVFRALACDEFVWVQRLYFGGLRTVKHLCAILTEKEYLSTYSFMGQL